MLDIIGTIDEKIGDAGKIEMMGDFIERRIVTGLIVSTEYIRETLPAWNIQYLLSSAAREIAGWCVDHYRQYHRAPGRDIEGIFAGKLNNGMPKSRADDIEEILSGLSRDYEHDSFNLPYLLDETQKFFKQRNVELFCDKIQNTLNTEGSTAAEYVASNYRKPIQSEQNVIDPFASRRKIHQAFAESEQPLIRFGKALGEFWDEQFTRDSFIALMAPEKRGKTYMLMEVAMRAMRQNSNVAFFQAGDMSERQQLKRLCVYLAKRSDKARYCKEMYVPVVDCEYNQLDSCDREERECDFGVFESVPKSLKYDTLVGLFRENPDYKPCTNCKRQRGVVWLRLAEATEPLHWKEAWERIIAWRRRNKKQFRLCTYANETLTVAEMRMQLDSWERSDDFVPDVIVIDYADILTPEADIRGYSFRDQTNRIWQRLRSLNQERHCLVVTATQSDAASYEREVLRKANFSEDKRKYAHVTAMYGLNQTEEEKRIGIMRINELVIREGEFYETNQVRVLQRLQMGQPYLGSFK